MNWLQRVGAAVLNLGASQPEKTRQVIRVSRSYAGADRSRQALDFRDTAGSADAELSRDFRVLRARSRQLERDSSYAKRAKHIVVTNVVGSGIGMQAQVRNTRNTLQKKINSAIEEQHEEWARATNCHTGGELHFSDLERVAMGQVFDAGEVFVRMHNRTFGESRIPFALELIESERVPERIESTETGRDLRRTRLGIERDRFHRPTGYWVRALHRNDFNYGPIDPAREQLEFVPAADMIHLRVINRWPQSRGVPWLHVAIAKIGDMNGYTEAEIVAARAAANYFASVEMDDIDDPEYVVERDGSLTTELEPGSMNRLLPGEKLNFHAPNRPNAALDPFMRYMLREVAAGLNVSYESLSRDYSQSNYSSSRLSLLDDRDTWRQLQFWYLRSFRVTVYRRWLQAAVFANQIAGLSARDFMLNDVRYCACKFKPRGWGWVDPQKEVAAYKEAIRAGLTTRSRVVASTAEGLDVDDVNEERADELVQAEQLGLSFDVDNPATAQSSSPANARETPDDDDDRQEDDRDDDDDDNDRNQRLRAVND